MCNKLIEQLKDAIITALPYVESEEENPAYKKGAVRKVVAKMNAAIEAQEPVRRSVPESLVSHMSEQEIESQLSLGSLDNETLQAFCSRLLKINEQRIVGGGYDC